MVEIRHTTDDRMADAVVQIAEALDRFTDAVDRLVYIAEDIGLHLGLHARDGEEVV